MILTRREATSLTISTCLVGTMFRTGTANAQKKPSNAAADMLPAAALHNPKDTEYRRAALDKTKEHVHSKVREQGPHKIDHLDHSWTTDKKDRPKGGTTVIIDKEGNWSFSALFDPYHPKPDPNPIGFGASAKVIGDQIAGGVGRNAAIIFALRSSLGYVMTWEAGGFAFKEGLSWSKQGHDRIVKDLWPDVVKGHKWFGVAVFSQLMTAEQASGAGGGHQEGNSGLGDVAGALGTVGAIIAAFF